ncbi:hypothetical protein [Paracoccus beibuensis]|uniref:hypothetical protein n=1 Tax=Paracoccus beibuensis TaxID=547602 RepID=UPI00223E973D|nr:hypothetical protein [Paracoccus beibuensis]
MAMGLRRKMNPAFVINLRLDGERGEGSTWAAVMSASAETPGIHPRTYSHAGVLCLPAMPRGLGQNS